MAMPKNLKNWNIFLDGENWAGQVEEIELPKIAKKVEDYQGAGMSAPVSIPMGYEKMELSFSCAGLLLSAEKKFQTCGIDKIMLRFSGSYQDDVSCIHYAGDIIVRGMITEREAGTAKNGEKNTRKYMMHLAYYKEVVNGETITEIDALSPQNADIANNIGL